MSAGTRIIFKSDSPPSRRLETVALRMPQDRARGFLRLRSGQLCLLEDAHHLDQISGCDRSVERRDEAEVDQPLVDRHAAITGRSDHAHMNVIVTLPPAALAGPLV